MTNKTQNFISKAKKVHGDKYDYSCVEYINTHTKINIICSIHGEFKQTPHNHLKGMHCVKCRTFPIQPLPLYQYIEDFNKIHKFKYDYSKVDNIHCNRDKITIKCYKHGHFTQRVDNHKSGAGCPKCNISKGEQKIIEALTNKNVKYIFQYKFSDCVYINTLLFDFYLPDHNMCIEFDGEQHFKPVSFSSDKSEETKIKNLKFIQLKDKIKDDYCIFNNITMIRISYKKYNDIPTIVDNILAI